MPRDSRSASFPQSIGQIIDEPDAAFGRLLRRARALERLNRRVSRLLEAELARHCQLANVRDGRMIFACTSPGCATRLRMQSQDLLRQLHAAGYTEIEGIEVRMMVPLERH